MRLELAAYPVRDVRFGAETRWRDEVLHIDRDEILDLVRRDPLVARAALEVVRPGESARIVTIQDIIEPRVKAAGKGVAYPGLVGRAVETVGSGRTNRLAGLHADALHAAPGRPALRAHLLVPPRHRVRRFPRHVGAGGDQPLGGHRQPLPPDRAGPRARARPGQSRHPAGDDGRPGPPRRRDARRDPGRRRGAGPHPPARSARLRLRPQHRVARAHLPEPRLDAVDRGLRHHAAHPAVAAPPDGGPRRGGLRELLQRRLLPLVHVAA